MNSNPLQMYPLRQPTVSPWVIVQDRHFARFVQNFKIRFIHRSISNICKNIQICHICCLFASLIMFFITKSAHIEAAQIPGAIKLVAATGGNCRKSPKETKLNPPSRFSFPTYALIDESKITLFSNCCETIKIFLNKKIIFHCVILQSLNTSFQYCYLIKPT